MIKLNDAYPTFLDDLKVIRYALNKNIQVFLPCREIFYMDFETHINNGLYFGYKPLITNNEKTLWQSSLRKKEDGFHYLINFDLEPARLREFTLLSSYYSRRYPTMNEGLINDFNWIAITLKKFDIEIYFENSKNDEEEE